MSCSTRSARGAWQRSEANSPANRRHIAGRCRDAGITLASHDDATAAHVEESRELGIALAEFPTTLEAARLSREAGLSVLMGAPNVVRGGSHSGNVSAKDLVEIGVLDVLSSDYVPFSLIQATFVLAGSIGLPAATAMVTRTPARSPVSMTAARSPWVCGRSGAGCERKPALPSRLWCGASGARGGVLLTTERRKGFSWPSSARAAPARTR